MKKSVMMLVSLLLVFALVFAGCGAKADVKVPELKKGEALELTEWTMNATAWSSPNGATVNLTAAPNGFAEGQSAVFCVRLEGEEIANVPCQWDGAVYTASADLNAADGYCYYVILTAADGTVSEVSVNTPTAVTDKSLVNMQTALQSYCEADITDSKVDGDKLVVVDGVVKIQVPWLTLDQGTVSCQSAVLVLSHNGQEVARQEMTPPTADSTGLCQMDISGISYEIPAGIEDDHQLSLRLDVVLSNGHSLTAPGGN